MSQYLTPKEAAGQLDMKVAAFLSLCFPLGGEPAMAAFIYYHRRKRTILIPPEAFQAWVDSHIERPHGGQNG